MADHGRLPHFLNTSETKVFARVVREYASWNARTIRMAAATIGLGPLRFWENLRYRRNDSRFQLHPEPVFIIGHWMSGHSVVHNLLACDPQFATVQLRHAIAPGCFRTASIPTRKLLEPRLPRNRGVDELPSGLMSLQGDDFLLAGLTDRSIYHAYVFPKSARDVFERSLFLETVPPQQLRRWKHIYHTALTRVAAEQGRPRVLSRSASNTTRIPQLLAMFPRAKFIHTCRHPENILAAQQQRWRALTDKWSLQSTHAIDFRELAIEFYERTMRRFFKDSSDLTPGQLCQIRYEELMKDPVRELTRAYEQLGLGPIEPLTEHIQRTAQNLIEKLGGTHESAPNTDLNAIADRWRFAFETLGYKQHHPVRI